MQSTIKYYTVPNFIRKPQKILRSPSYYFEMYDYPKIHWDTCLTYNVAIGSRSSKVRVQARYNINQSENSKTENFKICNFAFSNPVKIQNLLCFPISLSVSEKSANLCFFNFFLNFEKISEILLSIDNIAAKFEDATPCCYRDMLRTKTNRKIGSFFKISNPWP